MFKNSKTKTNKNSISKKNSLSSYLGSSLNSVPCSTPQTQLQMSFPQEENDLKLVAVVVTIFASSSYDTLFRSKKQESEEGTKTHVYQSSFNDLPFMQELIHTKRVPTNISKEQQKIYKNLLKDVESLPNNDACVFNFECCGHCSDKGFSNDTENTAKFIFFAIEQGFMVMNSDFSLKALIASWSKFPEYMGPNPFIKTGGLSGQFNLHFEPNVLKECPSSQLNKVGELCEKGTVSVSAASDTILYTVDFTKTDHSKYDLEVLSIVEHVSATKLPSSKQCKVGSRVGLAGHVLLTFPSGGLLLTSCGHWIALVDLDVAEGTLLDVCLSNYGAEKRQQLEEELSSYKCESTRKSRVKEISTEYVQKSCAANSRQKSKSSKYSY